MKNICAITMVRNDNFFLEKWINYYGTELGFSNLFVYFDGEDLQLPTFIPKDVNTTICKRSIGNRLVGDKKRIEKLSGYAKELFELKGYDIVIGTDADEYLVVDPKCGKNLKEYLSSIKINNSVSGLGVDFGQDLSNEGDLNNTIPYMKQRKFGYLCSRYTKTNVISKPIRWGSGFHRIKGKNFKIDKNLFLFHFGSSDKSIIEKKFNDKEKMNEGWENHFKKRMKTIHYVNSKKRLDGNKWLKRGRLIQTFLRPIYAINKPSMGPFKIIIQIPKRFEQCL